MEKQPFNTTVAVKIPRGNATRHRKEELYVRALRRHPYFDEIVKRIMAGKSVHSIARYCKESASKFAGVKNYHFFTWRLYISALRQRIRPLLKEVDIKEPTPELCAVLLDQMRRDNDLPIEDQAPSPKPVERGLLASMKRAAREINAEEVIKLACLQQADRIELLLAREQKSGVLEKNGYKEMLILVKVGVALAKQELGQNFMRAARLYNNSEKPATQKAIAIEPETSDSTKWSPYRCETTTETGDDSGAVENQDTEAFKN